MGRCYRGTATAIVYFCIKKHLSTYVPFYVIIMTILLNISSSISLHYRIQKGAFSMEETLENKPKKHICAALLAHVDAGKTTLSEALLYTAGVLRKIGRVDNRDAFLDTYELERARGITIFSKQAVLTWRDMKMTLLDTPGHVDFSAETERTLKVLDYAILVISGTDGVQSHTETLWRLLKRYEIPTFLFINKMDQERRTKETILQELRERLDSGCVEFKDQHTEDFYEELAMCGDCALEQFLGTGEVSTQETARMISCRLVFPCYFGSALKLQGVEQLLDGILDYTETKEDAKVFGARIYKITRDAEGKRLTHMKITGGSLSVKDIVRNFDGTEEKVNQIRLYSGEKYEAVPRAEAGDVCAVVGLSESRAGDGLGKEAGKQSNKTILTPVLTYRLLFTDGTDPREGLPKLRQLEEEEPELQIVWNDSKREIQVQMMGEIQIEVVRTLIKERFGFAVEFGEGEILYKETIGTTVEGVGHFEPLRHYAEVHLLLEPGESGSGLQYETRCSEDMLGKNWQNLILTHLKEREHKGILTGAPITDMKVSVIGGRAHLKHTEGGDFRQATRRAVRQGLMEAESILLEPYYDFCIELPEGMIGRAMTDIEQRCGTMDAPERTETHAILTGKAPVATMQNYQTEITAYTKGQGKISYAQAGYFPCHNRTEVIDRIGYEPEYDAENPTGSVFCAHGAGVLVEWDEVKKHMHVESQFIPEQEDADIQTVDSYDSLGRGQQTEGPLIAAEEIERILERTYHANKRNEATGKRRTIYKKTKAAPRYYDGNATYAEAGKNTVSEKARESYLLVDGYNIIFAWDELKELADTNMDAAKGKLLDLLCNYQAIRNCRLIAVFDAYRVEGHKTEVAKYHNIHVVYTKEAETSDQYIEKFAHENGRKYQVTVATSDGLEQIIIRGQGCSLISARELGEEIKQANSQLLEEYKEKNPDKGNKTYVLDSGDYDVGL